MKTTGTKNTQQKLWIIAEGKAISGVSFSRAEARRYKLGSERIFSISLSNKQVQSIVSGLNR